MRTAAAALLLLACGCTAIAPYQRGYLARPDMAFESPVGLAKAMEKTFPAPLAHPHDLGSGLAVGRGGHQAGAGEPGQDRGRQVVPHLVDAQGGRRRTTATRPGAPGP